MPNYFFVYHGGGMPETPEEGEKAMAAWGAWYGDMAAKGALVHDGGPAGKSWTVSAGGVVEDGGANPISGVTIVKAGSYAEACEMAKGCPMVQDGSGNVEVAQMIDM